MTHGYEFFEYDYVDLDDFYGEIDDYIDYVSGNEIEDYLDYL